jgi:CPA2 family monovalent cation:H+ antiporter-2
MDMGHVPLLSELAIIAILAVAVTIVLSRLRIPTVAGLLCAGGIAGPHGLGLTTSIDSIEALAEVGVVLLLFTIGLEFSLARIRRILAQVALGGLLQVGLTASLTTVVAVALGQPLGLGLLYGFLVSLSSTAIVLKALAERRELEAPHGRFIVGTLIFQDLCVVPMAIVVPLLGTPGHPAATALSVSLALGKAAVMIAGTLAVAGFVVPRVFRWVDASRSREVFLLATLAMCIGTAWFTSLFGLSLALGAFLGGMVVAETEYGHRALGDVLPLRDAFVSVFFVSLGMLFDPRVVVAHPVVVFAWLVGLVIVKGLLATVAALTMQFPARVAWLAGVGLAQFGEFGFVLAQLAVDGGLVTRTELQPVLTAGIASMFITPLLIRVAPHITGGERLLAPLERLIGVRGIDEVDTLIAPRDHVVIVGFGLAGRLTGRTLASCGIPYVVLDLNAESVRAARSAGLPVFYGDATSPEALAHAHLESARVLVLLMNDPAAMLRVVDAAKRIAPQVPILLRTRYLSDKDLLLAMGVREVVAEEVEGGVEIIARLLRWLEMPRNVIDTQIQEIRSDVQRSGRKQTIPRRFFPEHGPLREMKIESFLVRSGTTAEGRSAVSLRLRSGTGALVVALQRGDGLLDPTDPSMAFQAGDVVYLAGTSEAIRAACTFLDAGVSPDVSVSSGDSAPGDVDPAAGGG